MLLLHRGLCLADVCLKVAHSGGRLVPRDHPLPGGLPGCFLATVPDHGHPPEPTQQDHTGLLTLVHVTCRRDQHRRTVLCAGKEEQQSQGQGGTVLAAAGHI